MKEDRLHMFILKGGCQSFTLQQLKELQGISPSRLTPHDPTTCKICLGIGSYNNTPNKNQWFMGHQEAGLYLLAIPNKLQHTIYEVEA